MEQAGLRGYPSEYEGRLNLWEEGKPRDSAKDSEAAAEIEVKVIESRDKSQGCDGTEGVEGVTQAPKASDSALTDASDVDTVRSKLWELQRLLNNRKGGLSATYKKHTGANTRSYDLKQKTMQALDTLVEEYEIFEETMRKVTCETEEGDMLCAVASEVGEELERVLKDQNRLHDELEFTCEDMVTASKEFTNCWALHNAAWALHNAACANVNNTSAKLSVAFREVSNRRATHEATRSEVKKTNQRTLEELPQGKNNSLGWLGRCVKETVQATLFLTCGVLDRDSNEIRYLKQATRAHRGMATATSRCTACDCSDLRTSGGGAGRQAVVICRAPFNSVLVFRFSLFVNIQSTGRHFHGSRRVRGFLRICGVLLGLRQLLVSDRSLFISMCPTASCMQLRPRHCSMIERLPSGQAVSATSHLISSSGCSASSGRGHPRSK